MFAHHRQQLFQGYGSDVLKYANAFQILGRQWSDRLNVILSGVLESAQRLIKTLAVVTALLGEFVAINVRQEGLLLAEKFSDPDAGWIGSQLQLKEGQETAKNLITESITYFESLGDLKKVAAARVELAYCYWRDGELNEARIMLREALQKLTTEGTTRARAITKLVIIENSAARHRKALKLLTENASLPSIS